MHGAIVVIFAICQLAFRIAAGLQCKDFNFFCVCISFLFVFFCKFPVKCAKSAQNRTESRFYPARRKHDSVWKSIFHSTATGISTATPPSSFHPDMLFHLSFASLLLPSTAAAIVVNQALAGPPP
jgi:hypothetical protein